MKEQDEFSRFVKQSDKSKFELKKASDDISELIKTITATALA